ncbi:PREDICTED: protein pitchfork [Hipposideros armiger]|uniref:Protein pitchfork n=1 Tax=Hipposideros armiger TaxID=186990 RepID=A0A8B7Q603_HIPAR|nr:PREDICTED: protein pitchfork [Hipposideros armiger]
MCFYKAETLFHYSFGTCQPKKIFPHYHPPNYLGNKFVPLRGEPHRGPGCYITENNMYDLVYNLSKIPTSKKGYAFGARTAVRFKPISKVRSGCVCLHFSVIHVVACFAWESKGQRVEVTPGTYNPEIKPSPKINWPMKFGSPDWTQVPCLQKRTFKTESPLRIEENFSRRHAGSDRQRSEQFHGREGRT